MPTCLPPAAGLRSREARVYGASVFLSAVVLVPLLHVLEHAGGHEHSHGVTAHPAAAVRVAHAHSHEHAHPHDHAHPHSHDSGTPGPPAGHHGDGSLEHFGVALLVTQAFAPPAPLVQTVGAVRVEGASVFHPGCSSGPRSTRGPPVSRAFAETAA